MDLDLDVAEGTLTAILGASGSGKTTLLRVLIGFIAADRGTVSIGGKTVAEAGLLHVPPDRRAVGYVAQEGALFPHLTVSENVGFGLPRSERRGGAPDRRGSRARRARSLVRGPRAAASCQAENSGASRWPGRWHPARPSCCSTSRSRGSTRPRAPRPAPPSSARWRRRAQRPFSSRTTRPKRSRWGDEVGVLRSGRLVQTAPATALYRAPADLDVARFVGEAVVVPGTALGRAPSRAHSGRSPFAVARTRGPSRS